jgi:hypothetical protein
MPRAPVTSAAVGVASMDQPTTRREQASSTTAQYSLPSRVMFSDIGYHSWSGPVRANWRLTRSTAAPRVAAHAGTLGGRSRPAGQPGPVSSSTAWKPTVMPRPRVSSAWTRRLPWGLPGGGMHLADDLGQPGMWIARADGGRLRQA